MICDISTPINDGIGTNVLVCIHIPHPLARPDPHTYEYHTVFCVDGFRWVSTLSQLNVCVKVCLNVCLCERVCEGVFERVFV